MIGLGCMRLSTERDRDEARAVDVLHAALDAGITFFDTADAYCWDEHDVGHNERLIARGIPKVDETLWFQPPNLTPLAGSALNRFPDRETFVARFLKGGRKYPASPMPWNCYDHMTADDVAAIYEFLHSLPPAGLPSPQEPTVKHE